MPKTKIVLAWSVGDGLRLFPDRSARREVILVVTGRPYYPMILRRVNGEHAIAADAAACVAAPAPPHGRAVDAYLHR